MEKNKKFTLGILLSAFLGSTAIGITASIANNLLSTNSTSSKSEVKEIKSESSSSRTNSRVNYANHTIDGKQLHLSEDLILSQFQDNKVYFQIYTNVDLVTKKFPSYEPSYLMVEIRSSFDNQFKYIERIYPFTNIDNNPDTRQYAFVVERPTANFVRNEAAVCIDNAKGPDGWGTGSGRQVKFNYVVGDAIVINNVQVSGKKTYSEGEEIELYASPSFSPSYTPPDSWVEYEWVEVIDGQQTVIQGQTSSKLTTKIPSIQESNELQIICKATYNGQTKISDPYQLNIVLDTGVPSYVWGIVGGVGGVVLIGAIVAVLLILKKKKEQQAKASAKKMNASRANAPRLTGGNALPPASGPQGNRPINSPPGLGNRPGPSARPGAPASPMARPGASPQRPGMQKPSTPVPPKVNVNAPPKSLAPKRK